MLNKLLKYEFKATGRMFLPAYGLLIVMAVLQRIMIELNIYSSQNISVNILSVIIPAIFVSAIVAVFVITLVAMIDRFYKNLLGREGYLMFTLPVSVAQLMWSKIIVVVVWSILSLIVGILAFIIVFYEPQYFAGIFSKLQMFVSEVKTLGAGNVAGYCFEAIAFMISSLIAFVLMIYLCLAIGQLSDKHKGLCAFGAFIGINIVLNNILAVIFSEIFKQIDFGGISSFFNSLTYIGQIHISMVTAIIAMVIQAAIYFLITRHILTNKLNLE